MESIVNITEWVKAEQPLLVSTVNNLPEKGGQFSPEFVSKMLMSMVSAGYTLKHLIVGPEDLEDLRNDDDPDPIKARARVRDLNPSIWNITFQVDDSLSGTGTVYGIDDSDPGAYHICIGYTHRK